MTFKLGLTGSIGMGKSTAARMFRELGIPVWDADKAVHELYASDRVVIDAVSKLVPASRTEQGLDRTVLRSAISERPEILKQIEAIVHPAVAGHRQTFLEMHQKADLVVLEIPLLFELNLAAGFDAVAVVSTDLKTQRQRVLDRGTMTTEDFELILAKQVPDAEKRAKADFVIPSDSLEGMLEAIESLVESLPKTGSK